MAVITKLQVGIGFDGAQFNAGVGAAISKSLQLDKALGAVKAAAAPVTSAINSVGSAMYGLGASALKPITSLFSIQGMLGKIESGFNKAIEGEQLAARFATILGSAEQAKSVMEQVTALASQTSFGGGELKQVAMQLGSVGVAADQITPTLRTIASLANGDAAQLQQLSEIYSKAITKGSVDAKTLRQLGMAGTGIYAELANVLGVSRVQLDELTKDGEIGVSHLQQAFINLTTGSGRFANSLETQRNTTAGALTRMNADFNKIFTSIGKSIVEAVNIEALANTIGEGAQFVQETFIPTIKAGIAQLAPIFDFVWGSITEGVIFVYTAVEPIGRALVSLWQGVWAGISSAFASGTGTMGGWVSTAIEWLGQFTPYITFLRDTAIVGLASVEFAFRNWKDVLTLAIVGVEYRAVQFWGQLSYIFGTAIPAVAGFVGRNWRGMLEDMGNGLRVIGTNIIANVRNLFTAIWDYIRTRGRSGFAFAWTPLTDGFRSAVNESLTIAPRQIGALEQNLGETLQDLTQRVGGDYQQFIADRLVTATAPAIAAAENAIQSAMGPASQGLEANRALDAIRDNSKSKEISREVKALQLGTAEAISASRRRADDRSPASIERNTRETARQTARTADGVFAILNRTPPRPGQVIQI